MDATKNNKFYELRSEGEKESSPYVVTGMLQVFVLDFYSLHYLGDRLSSATPLISRKFDILVDILNEPFMVSTRCVSL